MNLFSLIRNFYIDFSIQRTFLGGEVESIDGKVKIYKTQSTGYSQLKNIFLNILKFLKTM
ncbi:MAG: hypothetical protein CK547_03315 [Chitinophagaceae bacterium]|nr:MAG: hypothetical protein CK547_03315 [Chitinophagaceae bacterium]